MLEDINKNWAQASMIKKLALVLVILLLFVGLVLGTKWIMHEDYQILFSDLNPQDAAAMIEELEQSKIAYKLVDEGETILVEKEKVYETRLKLMGKGLNLQGSVGFEIFNNAEFGMTEFAQKVNYQRALQGELARTIMGFGEVKFARVHLVLPESGLFKRKSAKPKASVSIVMKDNAELTSEQVSGIQRLVSASVPEVNAEEVTVVDQRGIAVTKKQFSSDENAQLPEKLEIKKQVEDYMIRKIVNVVDRVVGPGKAIVSVDATLNYDQRKILKDEVLPLSNTFGQDVGAVTRRRESSQGESMQDNLLSSGSTKGSSSEVEYSNSRRVEHVLSSQGGILRLSVGVLLPSEYDQVKIAKLKEMIAMVAGVNLNRGDGLVVYSVDLPDVNKLTNNNSLVQTNDNTIVGEVSLSNPSLDRHLEINEGKVDKFLSKNKWLLAAILALALVFGLFFRNRKLVEKASLTLADRERLLDEISNWANAQKS